MHKYISLFFLVLLFLAACGNSTIPDNVINQPKMVSLLADIHITDGSVYNIPQQPDSLYKYATIRYANVFKKHHLTDKDFKNSLKYYSTQPDKLLAIYDQLGIVLKAKLDSMNKIRPKRLKNAVPQK